MKSFEPNDKLNTISVYVLIVALFGVLCTIIGMNINYVPKLLGYVTDVLKPILYGFAFAFALHPIVKFTETKIFAKMKAKPGVKHSVSVIVVIITALLLTALILLAVVPQLADNYTSFVQKLIDFSDMVQNKTAELLNKFAGSDRVYIYHDVGNEVRYSPSDKLFPMSLRDAMGTVMESRTTTAQKQVKEIFANIIKSLSDAIAKSNIFSSAMAFINAAKNVLIGIIISIYFLIGEKKLIKVFSHFLRVWLPKKSYEGIVWLTNKGADIFREYIIVRLIDGFIVGLMTFLCLFVFRAPFSVLLAVIMGVMSFFPFIGPIIGIVLGTLITLVVDIKYVPIYVIIVVFINILDLRFVEPLISSGYSHDHKLAAVWVFAAIVVMGGFFGVWGIVIGIPVVAYIYSIIKELGEKRLVKLGYEPDTSAWFANYKPVKAENETKDGDEIIPDMETYFAEKREDEIENRKEIKEKVHKISFKLRNIIKKRKDKKTKNKK